MSSSVSVLWLFCDFNWPFLLPLVIASFMYLMLIRSLSSAPIQPLDTWLLVGLKSWSFCFFLGQKPWAVMCLVSTYIWAKKGLEFFPSQRINSAFKIFLPSQNWMYWQDHMKRQVLPVLCCTHFDLATQTFEFGTFHIQLNSLARVNVLAEYTLLHLCCTGDLRLCNHPHHCSFAAFC